MTTSYRTGAAIVLVSIVLGFAACLATVDASSTAIRAGQDLGAGAFPLGSFRLTERSGRTVANGDLAGRVWVASFIFTHCRLSCPRIASTMKGLQGKLSGSDVQLVSLTVDPERDTPEVLARYAASFGADPARWWFLTGSKPEVSTLVRDRFKLPALETSPADRQEGAEEYEHSDRLALVGRGNRVIGYFESGSSKALEQLVGQARREAQRPWVRRLPAVNATLNATSGLFLIVGWTLILAGRVRAHATCMIAACVVSILFLSSYLVYHYQAGSVPFRGVGPIRVVYFTILLSHTVLAVAIVPLIATTLFRAGRRDFRRHAQTARLTFPIWLYVSITGVVVYLMLYQLPPAS